MKRKKLTIIVAIALALVMICGGIAIYAVGDANEKRISGEDTAKGTPEASIESEAKVTTEPEAETNEDSEAKITPEPEAVEGEESDEQLWKLQLADTPAYIGVSANNPHVWELNINALPGTVDKELIAKFTEMLNGIRMTKVTDMEEFHKYCDERMLNSGFNDESSESFSLYNAEGRHIGTIFFSRYATFEYGKDFYPADNPGWCNWVFLRTENHTSLDDSEFFIIDESTFDEELLERMWKECLCGVNPYDFITKLDEVTAGNNPYGRKPINLYNIDVIKANREDPNSGYDCVIAVPVE